MNARQARDEARQEYEDYQEQQHDAEQRFGFEQKMSPDERVELKRLWRQASKLCHRIWWTMPLKKRRMP
jgi:hypothetical protein